RHVARHAGDEEVEALVRGARLGEKRAELGLADGDVNAARGEVSLNQLLERVVAAADGEQTHSERLSAAAARAVGTAPPSGGVEQRVGERRVARRRQRERERTFGRHRAGGGATIAGEGGIDDAPAVDRRRDRSTDPRVVERGLMNVEYQSSGKENRIG